LNKIKKVSHIFLGITVLLLPFLAWAADGEQTIVRPSIEKMNAYMVKGLCLMKRSQRRNMAAAIKELDNYHTSYLKNRGFSLETPEEPKKLIKARTGMLPSATTMCERTILYSLYLQLDMLDAVLYGTDREKAEEMREKRSKKRMLKAEDRIYGDYRDVFFYLAIDTLKDISDLQHCLGVEGTLEISFPRGLKKAQVEAYALDKIEAVTKRAQILMETSAQTAMEKE
jgi:hypothetical protein